MTNEFKMKMSSSACRKCPERPGSCTPALSVKKFICKVEVFAFGLLSKKSYTGRDMKSHNCTAHVVALFEIALTDHIWCIKQNHTHFIFNICDLV